MKSDVGQSIGNGRRLVASSRAAGECASALRLGGGFCTPAEDASARMLADAHVTKILPRPAVERMAYCAVKN